MLIHPARDRLAETEHLQVVRPLFDFPMKHCPEVLTAALVQTRPVWCNLKQELLSESWLQLPSLWIIPTAALS